MDEFLIMKRGLIFIQGFLKILLIILVDLTILVITFLYKEVSKAL